MNRLSSRQRKIAYFLGILLLLIPIIMLGSPASSTDSGGVLARMRQPETEGQLGLAEHNLGRVDPTSAAMNLVLLGLRGVAVNMLWMDYIDQQKTKNWAQMRSTTDSITMLQPHYLQIWRYHGWNLAYNVAAEWDDVRDRYYWIKEGAKFIIDGTEFNQFSPELRYDIGRIIGQKIGIADEWRIYRRYFNPGGAQYEDLAADEKGDPSPENRGGPDPKLNPEGLDNYLAAQRWYQEANDLEARGYEQHLMMQHIFRQYPYRCQLDYAGTLNREGFFGDVALEAWRQAQDDWITKYGQEMFDTGQDFKVKLELPGEADYAELARSQDVEIAKVRQLVRNFQNVVNYRYWRTRALSEAEPTTAQAHRKLFEGEELFKENELTRARKMLIEGLDQLEEVLVRYENLISEDLTLEEALWSLMLIKKIDDLLEKPPATDLPLTGLWNKHINDKVPSMQFDFNRRFGGL
ncbi:MAG: hypothetical protein VB859_07215 [Planctomycetaceae bacterium]